MIQPLWQETKKKKKIKQLEDLKEIAEKTGCQISFGNTEIKTNNLTKDSFKKIKSKIGEIEIVKKFKYLDETITEIITHLLLTVSVIWLRKLNNEQRKQEPSENLKKQNCKNDL